MPYYQRRLPHWQPDGSAIFVTWRLFGSLPATLFEPVVDPGRAFARFDGMLDAAHGGPLWLKDPRIADLVAQLLLHGEKALD